MQNWEQNGGSFGIEDMYLWFPRAAIMGKTSLQKPYQIIHCDRLLLSAHQKTNELYPEFRTMQGRTE